MRRGWSRGAQSIAVAALVTFASVAVTWTSGSARAQGPDVEVLYGDVWYPASVVRQTAPDRWRIAYAGYGHEWDEVVGPERLRPPGSGQPSSGGDGSTAPPAGSKRVRAPARLAVGTAVLVAWGGHWYAAHVVGPGADAAATARISYDGYDHAWDEDVGPERLRLAPRGSIGDASRVP